MAKLLVPADLLTLEAYAKARPDFRRRVMEHKAHRRVLLGEHLTLTFEDRLTMQYQELIGVEDRLWVRVAGHAAVHAIADEGLPRENDEKTSAVHFLRFELAAPMIASLKQGGVLAIGVDHENYQASIDRVPEQTRAALLADLD